MQKTAYEMRISDWSSDVCSSDLILGNLLENAFEAVAEEDERRVNLTLDYDEALLSLHVQDSGGGIEAAVREQIFQRGVSTKGERRGIGQIGRASCRERVCQYV